MKFSKLGICSRSEGTFGLVRERWTLSKTTLITCLTPLPSSQLDFAELLVLSLVLCSFACAGGTAASCQPIASAAPAASRISRFMPYPLSCKADCTLRRARARSPSPHHNPGPVIGGVAAGLEDHPYVLSL